ncbi:MAG: enoyl-CoA hydratase/isomerase family protein [Mucilaginibacter sp.]
MTSKKIVWENSGATIADLGDGIVGLKLRAEMNTINSGVIAGAAKAVTLAEEQYRGLVIWNEGENFCNGADLNMIMTNAVEQKFDELAVVVKAFQDMMTRIRYSSIPVVVAARGLALGAGCEVCLHADKVVTYADLYMGLDQFKAGLIPFGGGTKEFALRLSDEWRQGDIEVNNFRQRMLTIAQARVSTSAYEAFDLGYLKKGRDVVVASGTPLLSIAKKHCLLLADDGYVPPARCTAIRVPGKLALGVAYLGANSMYSGNFITEYDMSISQQLAFVMAGGDLSQPSSVSEDYLLGMEREILSSLCAEPNTVARMRSIINEGKVLQN